MSGWRERVEQALKGGDTRVTRDSRADIRAIGATVPTVPPPLDLLTEWCRAVESLDICQPLKRFDQMRWGRMVDASEWWLVHFGKQAALDGWTTSDVFGVRYGCDGTGGLIDRLGNARGLVMDGPRARWRSVEGVARAFNSGTYCDLPAFWEVRA